MLALQQQLRRDCTLVSSYLIFGARNVPSPSGRSALKEILFRSVSVRALELNSLKGTPEAGRLQAGIQAASK